MRTLFHLNLFAEAICRIRPPPVPAIAGLRPSWASLSPASLYRSLGPLRSEFIVASGACTASKRHFVVRLGSVRQVGGSVVDLRPPVRLASTEANSAPPALSPSSAAASPSSVPHDVIASSSFLTPPEATAYLLSSSHAKCSRPPGTTFLASFLGGAYLAFGGMLSLVVAGGCAGLLPPGLVTLLGAAVFPVGLSMIVFSGTDLLTGNMMYGTVPLLNLTGEQLRGEEGAKAGGELARILWFSFLGNLVGSAFLALALGAYGGVAENAAVAAWVSKLAAKKCALPWFTAFARGVGANWVSSVPSE
ncbi:Formate/nitrite transporter-domain-containing protein [Hyaloraphidium curvatum]|nr:Formate/nitrite transporter-domain-containing protein [Hyaloraphidium curvatum]